MSNIENIEKLENNVETNQNNNSLPTVTIGFPVRNREKYLPHFLQSILNLDYPKHLISIVAIVNDSEDNTERILLDFKMQYENPNDENKYNRIKIKKNNKGTPKYDENRKYSIDVLTRVGKGYMKQKIVNSFDKVYKNLGKFRNSVLYNANSDYLFSVDTDIIFPPHTLKQLMSHNKDYVAGLICNGYVYAQNEEKLGKKLNAYDYTNIMYKNKDDNLEHYKFFDDRFSDLKFVDENGLLEVDNTGAIFLISKNAYKSGASYDYHINGEDAYMSEELQKRGFKLYCDVNMRCTHLMNDDFLEKWKQGDFKW